MTAAYDAIIIGGGHNGLIAAAYLGRAGAKVLLAEARSELGGCAARREFAPGFSAPIAAHLLFALHPRIRRDLDLDRHGLDLGAGPLATIKMEAPDRRIELAADPAYWPDVLRRFAPEDATAYPALLARLGRFADRLGFFLLRRPPAFGGNTLADRWALGEFALRLRLLGRKDMLELTRILAMNVADLATDYLASDSLKGQLAFDATLGLSLGPRAPNTVFHLLYRLAGLNRHGLGGYYLPKGGMAGFVGALEGAAMAAGAVIRKNAPVREILIEKGKATGIALADGSVHKAPLVASSLDPQTTLLKLVPAGELDPQFTKRIRHLRMNGCVARLNLALDALPENLPRLPARLVVAGGLDPLERAADAAKYGRIAEAPALEMTLPSLTDPGLAPPGRHVASVLYHYAPYRLRETSPDMARAEVRTRAIAALEAMAPGFARHVAASEVLLPGDLESELGLAGGQWHQGELTLDQMFLLRPSGGHQRYRMPIPGLYLCGAGAHPGGHLSGAPGANAAREMIADLKSRRG